MKEGRATSGRVGQWQAALAARRGDRRAIAARPLNAGPRLWVSSVAPWLEALLARYGASLPPRTPLPMVPATGLAPLQPQPSVLHKHLRVALTWAPQLSLVLGGHHGALAANAGWPQPRALAAVEPVGRLVAQAAAASGEIGSQAPLLMTVSAGPNPAIERIVERLERTDSVRTAPSAGSFRTKQSGVSPAGLAWAAPQTVRVVQRTASAEAAPRPHAPAPQPQELRWERPSPVPQASLAGIQALDADPAAVARITDRVMQQIGQRIQAHRERTGRA